MSAKARVIYYVGVVVYPKPGDTDTETRALLADALSRGEYWIEDEEYLGEHDLIPDTWRDAA